MIIIALALALTLTQPRLTEDQWVGVLNSHYLVVGYRKTLTLDMGPCYEEKAALAVAHQFEDWEDSENYYIFKREAPDAVVALQSDKDFVEYKMSDDERRFLKHEIKHYRNIAETAHLNCR